MWITTSPPRRATVRQAVRLAACAIPATILCAACGSTGNAGSGGAGRLAVVATTTQLGDFVRVVGGNAASVHQILQPNSDPHEYEPRPDDVLATADAKLVFLSGDKLDAWMGKIIGQAGGAPTVVDVSKHLPTQLPGESNGLEASTYDPHWWHDPRNAEAAVATIRDALIRADPAAAATYQANAAAYLAKLHTLDAGIAGCFASIPPGQRKLVSDHDAFNYFAHRYAITIVGAIIPSQTTQAQPSAGEVAQLIAEIRSQGVKAIFPESSLNPKLAQQVAHETGARSDLTLYGDTLGPAGSPGATYLGMEQANADAMTQGFTGGTTHCRTAGIP